MSSTVGAGLSEGCTYGWAVQLCEIKKRNKEAHPQNPRRVDGDEIPRDLRAMGGDKLPRGFLCKRLRGLVNRKRICSSALRLHRLHGGIIPVAFRENPRYLGLFEYRDKRRRENHTLQRVPIFQGGVQDRCSSLYCRDDEICMCIERQTL